MVLCFYESVSFFGNVLGGCLCALRGICAFRCGEGGTPEDGGVFMMDVAGVVVRDD